MYHVRVIFNHNVEDDVDNVKWTYPPPHRFLLNNFVYNFNLKIPWNEFFRNDQAAGTSFDALLVEDEEDEVVAVFVFALATSWYLLNFIKACFIRL